MSRVPSSAATAPARRAIFSIGLVLASGLVAACDRPRVDDGLLAEAAPRPFTLEETNVADGTLASHDQLELRFTRPLDPASVGRRSVRVIGRNSRALRQLRIWSDGEWLFVAPPPGGEFPAGELAVRIAGRPSPRSVRSADGALLGERTEVAFRAVRRRRLDLVGPRLVGSRPSASDPGAAPGSPIELRFSEPLSRGAVRGGEAIALRVDGSTVPARSRLSPDLTRIVVRPRLPLPPDAAVEVEVLPALLDTAGNPAPSAVVRFRTKATRLSELSEDFVAADMADTAVTTSAWADPLTPGFLVARAGRVLWTPGGAVRFDRDLGSRRLVRFQVVFPPGEVGGSIASGLRLTLVRRAASGALQSAVGRVHVQVGPTQLDAAEPTFEANRGAAELRLAATGPVAAEPVALEGGLAFVDVPFAEPIRIEPGGALLLDVELELEAGLALAATIDSAGLALLQDAGHLRLLPAAELLVSGGTPRARSGWYDSGSDRPMWQTALVELPSSYGLSPPVVEYQTAPAGPDGLPALDQASDWDRDLGRLPDLRYVRFRVGFPELGPPGGSPRIDRIVMPYEF